jgi:SAM-dependent methyltransferase
MVPMGGVEPPLQGYESRIFCREVTGILMYIILMDVRLLELCEKYTTFDEINQKRIIDVGSQDINGSFRDIIIKHNPSEYIGIDFAEGKGVDRVLSIYDCADVYGEQSFDIVISTETIEHIEDWRSGINNLKKLTKIGGIILLTSRSKGFGMHGFPHDHWRYEISDISEIFSNWNINILVEDGWRGDHFGFFLKATKTTNELVSLDHMALYNINTDPRQNPKNSHLRRIISEDHLDYFERGNDYAAVLDKMDS